MTGRRAHLGRTLPAVQFGQVAAFLRRDVLTVISYRAALLSEWLGLMLQVVIFSFVAGLVDATQLPDFGGRRPTYLEFATVGIAVGAFTQLGLIRLTAAIRREQLIGTLEQVLVAPLRTTVFQVGTVAFELLYAPIRILIFLLLASTIFGLELRTAGLLPAAAVCFAFLLVVWGLGIAAGAAVMTFRRGSNVVGAVGVVASVASGAYFPIELLPDILEPVVAVNPVALAMDGVRQAMLGGVGWAALTPTLIALTAMAVPSVALGDLLFRAALHREARLGRLGSY